MSKKNKSKGPIRWEAVLPISIIMILLIVFFTYFFDGSMKRLLEFAGTKINGAEVNIGSFRTSIINASLTITDIAITNKNQPDENFLQISKINFELIGDALLRAKLVIRDATIENIQLNTKRKKIGYVIPIEKRVTESPQLANLENNLIDQMKDGNENNLFSDIANLAEGVDPKDQIKSIKDDLTSSKKIKDLEKVFIDKKEVWNSKIAALPKSEELKSLENRIKNLKIDTKDPVKFAASVNEAQKLIKEVDEKIKQINETKKLADKDLSEFDSSLKDLEKQIKSDLKDLESRLKIPKVDVANFSKQLFGKMIAEKLGPYQKYFVLLREYLPPKKTEEDKALAKENQLVPSPRGLGKTFRYPITTSYPLFWLQKAKITSSSHNNTHAGDLSGSLTNFTSNPIHVGKPAKIDLTGDFPNQNIRGFQLNGEFAHNLNPPEDKVKVKVQSYPVGEMKISDSNDLKLSIVESIGSTSIDASMINKNVLINFQNNYSQLKHSISGQSKLITEIVNNVFSDLNLINVQAFLSGPWDNLKIKLNSNLGDELSKGFKKELQRKIDQAKQQLKAEFNSNIEAEKQKLNKIYADFKGKIDNEVKKAQDQLEQVKKQGENQIENSKKSAKQEQNKKVEDAGKKALEGLKKKFKIK